MVSPAELKYFIEVAISLNFSRASERIGISQPSLSTAIKRLETTIGAPLFLRHKHGVSLTPAGKQLLTYTKKLLHDWDMIKSQALASHHEVQGSYSLGMHPSIGLRFLANFFPNLLIDYPNLEIQLEYDISRKITEQVINLSVDIGIVVNPVKHPDLIMQKLLEDEVTFWQAVKVKNNTQALNSKETVILCDPELTQTQTLLKQAQKNGLQYGRIVSSKSLEVIASLVAEGCGIGILPKSVALSMHATKLKPVNNMPVYQDEIYLIYRPEHRDIKAFQVIINAIKSKLKNNNRIN